jgi:hypothetical protein
LKHAEPFFVQPASKDKLRKSRQARKLLLKQQTYAFMAVVIYILTVVFGYFLLNPKTQMEWLVYFICLAVSAVLTVTHYVKAASRVKE